MIGRSLLPAAMAAFLFCAGCSPDMKAAPLLTSGTSLSQGKREPVQAFHLDDRIAQLVDFTWSDASADGGVHLCEWRWFRDGQLVSESPVKRIWFNHTPFTLHTVRPAGPLGVGHYTVQTIVDGDVVATSSFSIVS